MDSFGYKYLVAIRCMTFLHANYITDALNGFCMQQTEFPYVCMVVDDASTDGEQNVIREYIAEHFVVTETRAIADGLGEYVIAKHKKNANCDLVYVELSQNLYRERERKLSLIRFWQEMAKYEALCEGDDYWTDPKKLQKQVDFLESHPEYSMCFSNAKVIGGTNEEVHMYDFLQNRDYQAIDILKKWTIPTCTVLYRRGVRLVPNKSIVFGDIYLFLQLAQQGKVRCQNEEMACYRRHPGSASSIKSNEEMLKLYMRFVKQYEYMAKIFAANKEVSEECRNVAINNCNYVIYDNSSLLYDRFICIYRRARLRGASLKSFCCSVYTYVIKPYLHLK